MLFREEIEHRKPRDILSFSLREEKKLIRLRYDDELTKKRQTLFFFILFLFGCKLTEPLSLLFFPFSFFFSFPNEKIVVFKVSLLAISRSDALFEFDIYSL